MKGVARIFLKLSSCDHDSHLRNIYLNATGISKTACKAIASYLSSPHCKLQSLYMNCNPTGDAGAVALAEGLARSASLLRLSITSCGLKSIGAQHIMTALKAHPCLMTLNIGQNYATDDLGARYNWLEDRVVPCIKSLVQESKTLRMLELGESRSYQDAIASLLFFSIDCDPSSSTSTKLSIARAPPT